MTGPFKTFITGAVFGNPCITELGKLNKTNGASSNNNSVSLVKTKAQIQYNHKLKEKLRNS